MNPSLWTEDQAILYLYDCELLRVVKPGGTISTSEPSPLTRDEIAAVLLVIAAHRNYEGQTIICHDKEFQPVIMRDGEIIAWAPA